MNKLARIIDNLEKEDLIKIKRDLIAGNIDRLIEKKLRKYPEFNLSEKNCPVCGGDIEEGCYILEFGSSYLRRRAFFDALDCLEYFVQTKLKNIANEPEFDDKDDNKEEF
ncbi:MAG: hypothetical protein ACP5N3_00825 [Candidatus Nanoarchaeia archaeon]